MRSYRAVSFAILLATFLSGCGGPVRENRQINFSANGTNVGFQHGTWSGRRPWPYFGRWMAR